MTDRSRHDPYYAPPEARRFGVHPYEIRQVMARHSADVELALGILVRAAERCGANGELSRDRTLYEAVLKEMTMRMVKIAWSAEGWNAMAASDALIEIRVAMQAAFPAAVEDGGMGG